MQEKAFESIEKVYGGAVPDPHDFDRVDYVKGLHMVSFPRRATEIPVSLTVFGLKLGGKSVFRTYETGISS